MSVDSTELAMEMFYNLETSFYQDKSNAKFWLPIVTYDLLKTKRNNIPCVQPTVNELSRSTKTNNKI